jgi:hypothetical protein
MSEMLGRADMLCPSHFVRFVPITDIRLAEGQAARRARDDQGHRRGQRTFLIAFSNMVLPNAPACDGDIRCSVSR